MVTGRYRHFRNQKEYEALGNGIFGRPWKADLFGVAFDADDVSRKVNVYRFEHSFILEDVEKTVHRLGKVCVVYQAQYSDIELGDKPLFVRSLADFVAQVKEGSYSGPRFIPISKPL